MANQSVIIVSMGDSAQAQRVRNCKFPMRVWPRSFACRVIAHLLQNQDRCSSNPILMIVPQLFGMPLSHSNAATIPATESFVVSSRGCGDRFAASRMVLGLTCLPVRLTIQCHLVMFAIYRVT
jgi:hypothetical protein